MYSILLLKATEHNHTFIDNILVCMLTSHRIFILEYTTNIRNQLFNSYFFSYKTSLEYNFAIRLYITNNTKHHRPFFHQHQYLHHQFHHNHNYRYYFFFSNKKKIVSRGMIFFLFNFSIITFFIQFISIFLFVHFLFMSILIYKIC